MGVYRPTELICCFLQACFVPAVPVDTQLQGVHINPAKVNCLGMQVQGVHTDFAKVTCIGCAY